MSITVSNCNQICNSPLNTSQAKQLFSFPKSTRFGEHKKQGICDKFCYDLPSVKMNRTSGFGYGQKYDFTKSQGTAFKNPAPNNYNVKSEFQSEKEKKKGFSIGTARDDMPQQGILGGINKLTPGPGKYDIASTRTNIQFSFRERVLSNDPFHSYTSKYPGPGTYQPPPSINDKGKYFVSKFKSSGVKNFDPPRSKRFPDGLKNAEYQKNIGPGQYKIGGLDPKGTYFLSNNKNSKVRSFPHDMRRTISMGMKTPGPGTYRMPSEFGHYESARNSTTSLHVSAAKQSQQQI